MLLCSISSAANASAPLALQSNWLTDSGATPGRFFCATFAADHPSPFRRPSPTRVKGFSAVAVSLSDSRPHDGVGKINKETGKTDSMNTTEILKSETPNRCLKHLVTLKPVKQLLAVCAGALVVLCGTLSTQAQTVYSVNIVGCVPDMTITLLTAPLTTAQRQALHAQNFKQLAPSARALYLRVVAYAVGIILVGSELEELPLAEYLKSASLTGVDVAASPELLAHKAVVKEAMRELNVLIASQVANNSAYQQAMDAGAVDSIFDEIEDFEQ
jgi:hypothetical protein